MLNFQGIIFIWSWACSEIFKSALVYFEDYSFRQSAPYVVIDFKS